MDKKVLQAIKDQVKASHPAVLATIVQVSGSVPRHEGAQMLIFSDGRTVGTIGGGCGEAGVRREALIVLDDGQPRKHRVLLNSDLAADEGMVCGGVMDVFLEQITQPALYQEALHYLESMKPAVLVSLMDSTVIKGIYDLQGTKLAGEDCDFDMDMLNQVYLRGKACLVKDNKGYPTLYEPILPEEKLLILGAGHVGLYVAEFGAKLDFKVTVVDDRPDFANRSRFPNADQILCTDFGTAIDEFGLDTNTYIVIVTRGHQYDEICLRKILGRPHKYLGMIGSRRRVKLLLNKLHDEGFALDDLEKVKTPIGLSIGAETPAEIAISILGEIITRRRLNR